MTYGVLKGLSTLLKAIAKGPGEAGDLQEIESLTMDGCRICVAGNSNAEIDFVGAGLAKIGMGQDDSIDWLKPCYAVLWNDDEKLLEKVQIYVASKKVWLGGDFPNTTHLKALAEWAGWDKDFTATLTQEQKTALGKVKFDAIAFGEFNAVNEANIKAEKDLQVLCGLGCKMMGCAPKSAKDLAIPAGGRWGYLTGDNQHLPVKDPRKLRLVKLVDNPNLHAEQRLLYALAVHLKMGGTAKRVIVAGHKPPCQICQPVLDAFQNAYFKVYSQKLVYDTSAVGGKNESLTLQLPEPNGGDNSSQYYLFFTKFNALIKR
jgi:hypothetical protein